MRTERLVNKKAGRTCEECGKPIEVGDIYLTKGLMGQWCGNPCKPPRRASMKLFELK